MSAPIRLILLEPERMQKRPIDEEEMRIRMPISPEKNNTRMERKSNIKTDKIP